ncbi:hypothetical protein ACIQM4_34125 [Streptomyces sp. NPDC091272]|uniref:hypothetical protein n=1 Tax=Streptomyces sp. NPDC091272 TaxID=3365981 RepID=UPI00382B0E5B
MSTAAAQHRLGTAERRRLHSWAREISRNAEGLRARWTTELRASGALLPPDSKVPEADHLAPGGGFRLPDGEVERAGSAALAFFHDRVSRDGWTYLRGFGYYAADGSMYLPDRCPTAAARWSVAAGRWPTYADHAEAMAAPASLSPAPWYPWLAWLAFLESAVNDLCCARWTVAHLDDPTGELVLDRALEALCALLAEAGHNLWRGGPCEPSTWGARAHGVLADPRVAEVMRGIGAELLRRDAPASMVRSLREGDVLWQVLAAFEARWPGIGTNHPDSPVVLVSEAFGAMAVGPLWAGMLTPDRRARTELALSRHSFHEAAMDRVSSWTWQTGELPAQDKVVVHLDDSVFTGRTHDTLRAALRGTPEAVYLVALTMSVGSLFNHAGEVVTEERSAAAYQQAMEHEMRRLGGVLPPAPSMWARRERDGAATGPDPVARALADVRGGPDRLLALLWERYEPQIRRAGRRPPVQDDGSPAPAGAPAP